MYKTGKTKMGTPSKEDENDFEAMNSLPPDEAKSPRSLGSPRSLRQAFASLKKVMSIAKSDTHSEDVTPAAEHVKSLEEEVEELNLAPPNYKRVFTPRKFPIEIVMNKKKDWARDIVVTSNNGIRSELNDLYNLFAVMERRPLQLDHDDVDLLFRWYEVFNKILENFFELEEVCLFEWIEGRDLIKGSEKYWKEPEGKITSGVFATGRRNKRRGEILAIMRDVMGFKNYFEGYPVLQILPRFAKMVQQLVPMIEHYIVEKEELLVQIIEERLARKDRARYDYRFWSKMKVLDIGDFTFVCMMRWMSTKERKRWMARMKAFKIIRSKTVNAWIDKYEIEHHGVVVECEQKLRIAVEEKKAQIKIHENAIERAIPKSELSFIAESDLDDGLSVKSELTLQESQMASLVSEGC